MKKKILIVLLIIFFTVAIVPKEFQNDTFYTVTIGKDILEYGFDGIDHYSWHDGLSYTSPHWLFDVINWLIFSALSWDGLYVFVCVLACVTMLLFYYFLRKKGVRWLTAFAGTLVVAYLLRDSFTDRAQILTYMLFLIEINLIESFLENKNKKSVLGIFIISVIVANSHVAAWPLMLVLVLPYLGEYIFSLYAINNVAKYTLKRDKKKLEKLKSKNADEKKIEKLENSIKIDEEFLASYKPRENTKIIITKNDNAKYLLLVIVIILLGGLFTPTGSLPYTYFIKAMGTNVTSYISEHQPVVIAGSVEFLAMIIFSVTCVGFIDSKMKLNEGFLLVGLYFMTIVSRRHMILLILLGSPILIRMINEFLLKYMSKEENWEEKAKKLDNTLFVIFSVIAVGFGIYNIAINYDETYINEEAYPVQASEWLLSYMEENGISKDNLHLFNGYNYGSYLLYKGIPVFIDSRAEQPYCEEFNEGVTVFDDYMDMASGSISYTELFEKYNVNYALVYVDSLENTYMKEDENCIELYEDEYFVIYEYNN